MQTQIYILYALAAALALWSSYVMLICKERIDRVEDAYQHKVNKIKDRAAIINDIEKTVRSMKLCDTPGLIDCGSCMIEETSDGYCIHQLNACAIDLLEKYKKELENE